MPMVLSHSFILRIFPNNALVCNFPNSGKMRSFTIKPFVKKSILNRSFVADILKPFEIYVTLFCRLSFNITNQRTKGGLFQKFSKRVFHQYFDTYISFYSFLCLVCFVYISTLLKMVCYSCPVMLVIQSWHALFIFRRYNENVIQHSSFKNIFYLRTYTLTYFAIVVMSIILYKSKELHLHNTIFIMLKTTIYSSHYV